MLFKGVKGSLEVVWEVVFRGALLSISPGIQLTLLRRTAEQTFPVHDDDDDDDDDDDINDDHHHWTKGVVGRDMVAPPTAGDSQDRQKCKKASKSEKSANRLQKVKKVQKGFKK